jgi:hypothetical protein
MLCSPFTGVTSLWLRVAAAISAPVRPAQSQISGITYLNAKYEGTVMSGENMLPACGILLNMIIVHSL